MYYHILCLYIKDIVVDYTWCKVIVNADEIINRIRLTKSNYKKICVHVKLYPISQLCTTIIQITPSNNSWKLCIYGINECN